MPERLLEVVPEHLLHLRRPVAGRDDEPVREPLVQLGPDLLRQAVVRGVPDQHVPEAECVLARERRALLADQLLSQEPAERGTGQLAGWIVEERLDRAAMEDRSLHGGPLDHLPLGRIQLVEPRGEEHRDAGRDGEALEIRRHPAPVLAVRAHRRR